MKIKFICFYPAVPGRNIFLSVFSKKEDNGTTALPLTYINNNLWEIEIETDYPSGSTLKYNYLFKDDNTGTSVYDTKGVRSVKLNTKRFELSVIKDYFESDVNEKRVWESSIFSDILFNRSGIESRKYRFPTTGKFILDFRIRFTPIDKNYTLGISGNIPELGMWDRKKALMLNCYNYPEWRVAINAKNLKQRIEYKYVIINSITGEITHWESGNNHIIDFNTTSKTCHCVINESKIKFDDYKFRGAGVSIPVFSLKTKSSFGIGDFTDLKLFADWAVKARLKVIQILPVNDTTANYTYLDSYPYKTISVYSLNPVYLNIFKMGKLKSKKSRLKYERLQTELNKKNHVDYTTVLKNKIEYARKLFKEHENTILKENAFLEFIANNKKWLQPYATFCYLRDKHGTVNFNYWKENSKYSSRKITLLTSKDSEIYSEISFWYFIQYHLNKQLKEASRYTRSKGISIKGDVPIGVGRYSTETWSTPKLFHFNMQTGAPPDKFAISGQNWGFPTYNWNQMSKDNYQWWQARLKNMAEYFDVYRIDHILGFFRIWEIPYESTQGVLGHFNPAIPFTRDELQTAGIWVDYQRLCRPYIREHSIKSIFDAYADKIRKLYLNETELNVYELKDEFNTQRKIKNHFKNIDNSDNLSAENRFILSGLLRLATEIVLIPDDNKLEIFHPAVSMHSTYSYAELDNEQKIALDKLYIDYYYNRHEELWRKEAMKKLPALTNSTKMLVCGEDLGMIPSTVPQVMKELSILSLEIQRMPKNENIEFADPKDAPYLSVCTTSTHDTSTIRGWWEEDRAASQRFYNHQLGHQGEMPYFAEPWLCKEIINQHLHSPAMWAIFPLQDLLAISGEIRSDKTQDEQINVPSDPKHYWKYRMHIFIEDLIDESDFNRTINLMVKNSFRW